MSTFRISYFPTFFAFCLDSSIILRIFALKIDVEPFKTVVAYGQGMI